MTYLKAFSNPTDLLQNRVKNIIMNKQKIITLINIIRVMFFCLFITAFFTLFYSKLCNWVGDILIYKSVATYYPIFWC